MTSSDTPPLEPFDERLRHILTGRGRTGPVLLEPERVLRAINEAHEEGVTAALDAARANDPRTCEYGHQVYAHKSAAGWCCACEGDMAFLEGRIEEAATAARLDAIDRLKKHLEDKE